MGQAEVVVTVVQGQLLAQAVFALAQSGDAPADRRYMLTDLRFRRSTKAVLICQLQAASTCCTASHWPLVQQPGAAEYSIFIRQTVSEPLSANVHCHKSLARGMGSARGEACGSPGAAHDLLPLHRCDCQ
jgi:hypothetical protein